MSTTTRKQTPAQARKAALESDYTPFYAAAGLTQAVASTLQGTATKASEQLTAWQGKSEQQAKATADDVTKFVKSLPEQVKALPETTKKQVAEWQQQAAELLAVANTTYAELAGRGKLAVDETIGSARQLRGRTEKRAADVADTVADKVVETVDPALEQVQEGVTRTRKNVTGRTATETVTPRSAQQASVTRARKSTAKKAPAKKATAKKAPAKKAAASAS